MTEWRWKRAILFGLALSAGAVLIALSPLAWSEIRERWESRVVPRVAAPDEANAIVMAAIEQAGLEGAPPPPPEPGVHTPPRVREQIVLLTDTITVCDDEPEPVEGCPTHETDGLFVSAHSETSIARQFRLELIAANRAPQRIGCSESEWILCSDQKTIDAVFAGDGWWDDFHTRFPSTAGFAQLSMPVLSEDGRHALIYLSFSCGGLCGVGELLLMERTGVSWRIVQREMLWIS